MAVKLLLSGFSRWSGLSGDSKPTTGRPGSTFFETDTLDYFIWDGAAWHLSTPDIGGGSITVTSSALPAGASTAAAQATSNAHLAGYSTLNITDTADHLLHTGAAILRLVSLNTLALTSTLKVYDGTTAGGTLLATLDGTTAARGIPFDISCATGLFAKATGSADWTVTWE